MGAENWAQEGDLRTKLNQDLYISGAKWQIVNQNCQGYKVFREEVAQPWGHTTAVSDRTWCGDSCLMEEDCVGFLYPDPGQSNQGCKLIKHSSSDDSSIEDALDLSKWALHWLPPNGRNPVHYPQVTKDTN